MDSKFQFRDASPAPKALAPSFGGEWRRRQPPQELDRFAEADDCSDDTAAPRIARPQLRRSPEPQLFARNWNFESISSSGESANFRFPDGGSCRRSAVDRCRFFRC